jgi:hypothetical protein
MIKCSKWLVIKKGMIFSFLILIYLFSALPVIAQPEEFNHPELQWKTIETAHFVVHYHQGTVRTANLVSKIAEEIYPHITGLYQQWPHDKTHFIIRDTDDYSNGGAFFYENKIEIWAENMDYILRGTHNWLRDVVTHEFSHIVSIEKSFKFGSNVPIGLFEVFGYESERRPDVVRGYPNVLVLYPFSGITIPTWFAEGVAQYQSPSKRFDYRDSHREMILRDRAMTGHLLNLDEMSVFGKNSIGNESAYNQGYAFVRFLTRTYGDSIVRDMAIQAASPLTLNFNSVLKKTTGVPADSTFRLWKNYLQDTYSKRLIQVKKNLKEGKPLDDEGIGNIMPLYSPDGENLAYIQSRTDYLSSNALVVMDVETGNKKVLEGPIASSLSWSPDGRYLAFAKQTNLQPNGSSYYDLYVYDLRRYKSYQITRGLRASNPDWSHDGQKLVFVVHSDGLTNLFSLTLDEFVWINKKKLWHTRYYDLDNHVLLEKIPDQKKKHWKNYFRKTEIWGRGIQQLTFLKDGRQIFHPRWSPGDSTIIFDTSINFCRDIARIPAAGGPIEYILHEAYDERYPVFSPSGEEIYYASDQTGIFNIYSYNVKTGEISPHTNVVGGAFMPTVNSRGDLAYSLYKNQGYKIYRIQKVNHLPAESLIYDENYEARIPQIREDDRTYTAQAARDYKRTFGPIQVMPRLLIDYGTVKPGFYIASREILDKLSFFGGFDVNLRKDYDIFAITDFRLLKPTLFLEFYNQATRIEDTYKDDTDFTYSNDKIPVNFNLMEADFGLRGRFRQYFSWELSYIFSMYRANIGTYSFHERASGNLYIMPEFRYTYLRGHALSLQFKRQRILPELDRGINPRKGYYFAFRYTREWNRFLDDFSTEGGDINEVYTKYYYNSFQADLERYFPVPLTRHHSLSLRLQGGYIDRDVDSFFYFYAGGLNGLKGYNYYGIGGKQMAIGTVMYRFPLKRHINLKLYNWYLDKIYVGAFYQFGNAWSGKDVNLSQFLSDYGFQLRFDSFSWYMFSTSVFFEAAYPVEKINYGPISYNQDWKFYFGILLDFDTRFNHLFRRFK